jgi:ABC-type sugar transport system permease subunit
VVGAKAAAKPVGRASSTGAARRVREALTPYWFILPALLVLGAFIVGPVAYSFWISFHEYQWNMPAFGITFIGLGNYTGLFRDPDLARSVGWTASFALISVPIGLVMGFVLALLLNSRVLGRRARSFLRGIFGAAPVSWFSETTAARATVVVAELWLTTPFVALVLLAGLQGIPEEVYEAGRIDGASPSQTFWQITLPLLQTSVAIVLIIRTMDALRIFDLIFILTNGGPGTDTTTIMYYNYLYAFRFFQMGGASAFSFAILLVIALITIGYLVILRRADRD